MRSLPALVACVAGLGLAGASLAQDESVEDSDQPAAVVIMQKPPATKLESFELSVGSVITRGITRVGSLSSDDGAETNIYAMVLSNHAGAQARGLMFEVICKDASPVRCYVDEDEVPPLLEAMGTLAKVDKNTLPMDNVDAGYRTKGGIEIYNRDINGGRIAMIRTTAISSLTGKIYVARARFRVARLVEIVQQLKAGQDLLTRMKPEK